MYLEKTITLSRFAILASTVVLALACADDGESHGSTFGNGVPSARVQLLDIHLKLDSSIRACSARTGP